MKRMVAIGIVWITLLLCLTGCNGSYEILLADGQSHTEHSGVYLTLSSVDSSGEYRKLVALWHNETSQTVTFGNWFVIERKEGEDWINVTTADVCFTEEAYLLEPGSTREKSYTTEYADLSREGTYRVRTEYSLQNGDDAFNSGMTWVEFEVRKSQ